MTDDTAHADDGSVLEADVPQFAMVWSELLLDTSLSDGAVRLYAVLHHHCRGGRSAWPSRSRLAELLGRSVPTVQARLRELVDAGWVVVTPRHHDSGGQRSNLYQLRMRPVGAHAHVADEADPPVQDSVRGGSSLLDGGGTESCTQKYKKPKYKQPKENTSQPNGYDASTTQAADDERFADFWSRYPRHSTTGQRGGGGSKKQALKVWARMSDDDRAAALASVDAYRAHVESREGPWPAHAATWLRQERYGDWQDVASRTDVDVSRRDGLRAVMR